MSYPQFCEEEPNRDIAISTVEKFVTRMKFLSNSGGFPFILFFFFYFRFHFSVHKPDKILLQTLCSSGDVSLIEVFLTLVLYVRSSPVFTIAKTGVSL